MALESPIAVDGDAGFVGYASRINPLSLPAGMLQLSENMRLDRGVAKTRKGAKRLAGDINPAGTPLTVPFVLTSPGPTVLTSYAGGILDSTIMRFPDRATDLEIVVMAATDKAYTWLTDGSELVGGSWTDAAWAVDGTDNLVTDTGDELYFTKLPGELSYPLTPVAETVEATDKIGFVQAFNRLYLFREADPNVAGWQTKYTNDSGITVSGTTATINVNNHDYQVGMRVRIDGGAAAAFDGHEYDIATVAGAHSFTVTVPSATSDAGCNVIGIKVRRVKPPLYWSGDTTTGFVRTTAGIPDVGITYRTLHSAPFGAYINNRLVVPDGPQNVMLSDVFDADTFDPFWQSFRVAVGGNDRLVAFHPWVENSFLVFCRKSIWLAQVGQFPSVLGDAFAIDSAVSSLTLITDEVGCAARRSIATAGQFIYFLSDSGVYRLDSRLDLKLRGETLPLSDPIADQIRSLDATRLDAAVGLYFDNRYYLAGPTTGSITNDAVFIYSQLNNAWETKDVYAFGADNFLVSTVSDQRRLLITNRAGKLMLMDELETGDDSPDAAANIVSPVSGRIRTRRYGMGTMGNKRFVRSLADVVLPNSGAITVKANMVNPDAEITLVPGQTNTSGLSEDYTLKNPIRQKAHYAEIEFLTTANRPEIRNVSIEAALASRPQTETRHAA